MHVELTPPESGIDGRVEVPASKSLLQRALALAALAEEDVVVHAPGPGPGEDVVRLAAAMAALGAWSGDRLGASRERRVLDLGLGATGFRFAMALATLRPVGARTLVTGRPRLLARPHRPLRRALVRLGGHLRRRSSGAMRVLGSPLVGGEGRLPIEAGRSSQFASALMLLAPRIGGLELSLPDRPVSRPYLGLTLDVLGAFGIEGVAEGLDGPGGTIRVAAGRPACARYEVEGDASSAAPWWAAAALGGGRIEVRRVPRRTAQADGHLLGVLERMGARVGATADGTALVEGRGERLHAPEGVVDLGDAPDLLPIVGALAATAEGVTRIGGVAHARFKESDRRVTTTAAIRALGGEAAVQDDGIEVRGRRLRGGVVDAAGDHRIVLAFGVLALVVPGIVVAGAEAVGKSYPGFLEAIGVAGK